MTSDHCGFNENSFNEFLECCFDESHIVPNGPKVGDDTDKLNRDMKLWDFDPNCCIDLCHSPSPASFHSSVDTIYQPNNQIDHHCNNTPCCNRDDGLCDLDEHLKPDDLVNLDSILSKCEDVPDQDSLIKFDNISDIRDTLNHHHHHLLHLHHSDQNDNVHSHDLILHHHDHQGQHSGHHHHLKLPDLVKGEHDFILPNCNKVSDNLPVLKSDGVSDFITFANGDRKPANQVMTPVLKERLKRRLSNLNVEQRQKFIHSHTHFHNHQNHHNHCHNHSHSHRHSDTNQVNHEDDHSHDYSQPHTDTFVKSENVSSPLFLKASANYSDSHATDNIDMNYNQVCQWLDCCGEFSDLNKHVLENHIDTLNPSNDDAAFHCEWKDCNFISSKIEDLHEHVPTHTCKVKHICKWVTNGKRCMQEFDSTDELTNHLTEMHVGAGKCSYQCHWDGCERNHKPFVQRQKIVRHLNTHTKHQPFQCEICGKRFSLSLMLKQHMRIHTGETPYKCDICEKEFKTSSSLTIHKRVHSGVKPLECKICGKRFNESSNLNKHMKIHSRKFKCTTCHKSFDDELKYKKHSIICSLSK